MPDLMLWNLGRCLGIVKELPPNSRKVCSGPDYAGRMHFRRNAAIPQPDNSKKRRELKACERKSQTFCPRDGTEGLSSAVMRPRVMACFVNSAVVRTPSSFEILAL